MVLEPAAGPLEWIVNGRLSCFIRNELATALPPEVAEQLGLRRPAAQRGSNQAASSGKSSGLDFTFVIVFIVSAITVFVLARYVWKPAQVDDAGQAAPQVPVD